MAYTTLCEGCTGDHRSTWRTLLTRALTEHGETWADVQEVNRLTDAEMGVPFVDGRGGSQEPFDLWTTRYVYTSTLSDDGLREFVHVLGRDEVAPREIPHA